MTTNWQCICTALPQRSATTAYQRWRSVVNCSHPYVCLGPYYMVTNRYIQASIVINSDDCTMSSRYSIFRYLLAHVYCQTCSAPTQRPVQFTLQKRHNALTFKRMRWHMYTCRWRRLQQTVMCWDEVRYRLLLQELTWHCPVMSLHCSDKTTTVICNENHLNDNDYKMNDLIIVIIYNFLNAFIAVPVQPLYFAMFCQS